MNYIGKVISNFKDVYNEINGATLTGAIDAVVVLQEDGSYISSPFHVRFGKIGVLRSKEKVVDIEINGNSVDIRMKLGDTGEAFFVEEIGEDDDINSLLGTSPLPCSYFDNYHINSKDDDVRSQDSGVEAGDMAERSKSNYPAEDSSTCSTTGMSAVVAADDGKPIGSNATTGTGTTSTSEELASTKAVEDAAAVAEADELLGVETSVIMEVPGIWQPEDIVRSKSLTTETELLRAIVEGQGSKTDGEEIAKFPVRNPRRRRKKRTLSKKRRLKKPESQSSDNSSTSEPPDLSSLVVTGATTANQDTMFLMDDVENTQTFPLNSSNTLPKPAKNKNWTQHRTLGPDFHPFSDTDITPPRSPGNSRSETPVKSDTEYEYEKQKSVGVADANREHKWSWTWGELPTPPQSSRSNSISRQGYILSHSNPAEQTELKDKNTARADADAQRSMLGNMFSFMRATKKARRNPELEGIYLDDLSKLDEIDPEVAALYFPRNYILEKDNYAGFRSVAKDEDVESGNGTSLPQSPISVEGAMTGLKICDSDFEDLACRHHVSCKEDLAFSMCGAFQDYDGPFPEDLFLQSLVTYDDFCEKPELLYNPNLVVRLEGKYMNWATAAPQVMAIVLFQRPLPTKVVDSLESDNMPKKELGKRKVSKSYSWFSWGRNSQEASKGEKKITTDVSISSSDTTNGQSVTLTSPGVVLNALEGPISTVSSEPLVSVQEITTDEVKEDSNLDELIKVTAEEQKENAKAKKRIRNDSSGSEEADEDKNPGRYKKSLRLSSEQIKKLNLRSGSNEVIFSVTTAYQGTTRCKCHIFLWKYDQNIIVSDIDGTITKSDVLGQILPIIGKDWAQGGVTQLFTKIKNNGYNFLYLSARAIGQASITREYLRSVKQGDLSLPDGPLLLNPTSLIQAFHREVIEKKPEEFKISCLRDIKALFPVGRNPFYAGYGNKINDVYAYRAVGIPISRIFTINHRGELKHELTQAFQTTYSSLSDIAHHMFPSANNLDFLGEFSSLQYWRVPLPDLSLEIEDELARAKVK